MTVAARLIDVHKTYRVGDVRVPAVRGISLDIEAGAFLSIAGPSGSGKTTVLNLLGALDTPTSGTIKIGGRETGGLSPKMLADFRNTHLGFVFQTFNLIPVLTVSENVELPLLVSGVRLGEARTRALESLAQVGLAQRANHRPAELSGGERQRTTIARALVNRPALVWADEPTGDLDSETANEIMDVLVDLNREQRLTFIMVTHDRAVGTRCQRIIRMRDGLVEAEQPVTVQER